MEKWKKYIIEGNQFFKKKDFDLAILSYQSSKEQIKKIFDDWSNPEEAIAAILASYHNISELYLQRGQKHLSFIELQKARKFLMQKTVNLELNSRRWMVIQKGINKNEMQILSFMKEHQVNSINPTTTLLLESNSPALSTATFRGK